MAGAVWAVPVIAVSAAAPAMAASCPPHKVETWSNLELSGVYLGAGDTWQADSILDVTLRPALSGRHAWALFTDAPVMSHTLLTYSLTVTFPYPVAWEVTPTGWVRTQVITTAPNRWTYTWTAQSPAVVPKSMARNAPFTSFVGTPPNVLVLPEFIGTVSSAAMVSSGFRAVGDPWTTYNWTYPNQYASTYSITAPASCVAPLLSYGRIGGFVNPQNPNP